MPVGHSGKLQAASLKKKQAAQGLLLLLACRL
jgi:hypothetical protein